MNDFNKCAFFSVCSFCLLNSGEVSCAEVECSMTASNIEFGSVTLGSGSSIASTGTLTATCKSRTTDMTVRLCVDIDGGTDYDETSRIAQSSASSTESTQLRFQLYSDAAHTIPWGSWSDGVYSAGYSWDLYMGSTVVSQTKTVYGLILGGQSYISPDTYTSNLNMKMYYKILDEDNTACPARDDGSGTDTFTVSATVLSSCSVSTTNMNFGTVETLDSIIDATATVSPNCGSGTPYSVSLSNGNTGTSPIRRKMISGDNSVTYGLYQDAGRSLPWGNSIDSNTVGGTGTGSSQPITVYGRVQPQTTPSPATYTDTVVVTVTY